MTKNILLLSLILVTTIPVNSFASLGEGLVCRLENDRSNPKIVRLISHDIDIMRLQFTGLEPERYFSLTGKYVYTQFATKKNSVSRLVNKIEPNSTINREILEGGEKFTWKNGKESKSYICSREADPDSPVK